ncbi:SusC/RagA family TonB-linked outer membrane protein [Chitinophagaceae bacterium LWZ2-11]
MRKQLTLLLCFCLALSQLMAQNRTVTGKVVDEKGTPLAGVTISAKSAKKTTASQNDGTFSISLPTSVKRLSFSSVSFVTQELELNSSNSYLVKLASSSLDIEEVVVTGYSKQKKSSYVGAVAKVGEEQIKNAPVGSFDQVLQGKAPGVQVLSGSGQPGSSANVIIRGLGSIVGGNAPLYIIDGIPVEAGVFQGINPNDFESIDVLKDGASTALYGSRGSAGVIVATTKRGTGTKMKLNVSSQYGQTYRPEFTYTMMTTPQLLKAQEDLGRFYYNNGSPTGGGAAALPGWQYSRTNPNFALLTPTQQAAYGAIYDSISKINTNWDDQFFRTGHFSNTNIGLSGGTGKTRIYSNLGYYNEQGTSVRTDLKRVTLRTNIDYSDDKFTFSLSSNLAYSKRNFQQSSTSNSTQNPFLTARINVPYALVTNPDGSYATGTGAKYTAANLLDYYKYDQNYNDQIKATIGATGTYKITKEISAGIFSAIDFRETQGTTYNSPLPYLRRTSGTITTKAGSISESLTRFFQADIRPFVTYRKTFQQKHDVEVTAFGEYLQQVQKGFSVTAYGVDPKRPNTIASAQAGTAANQLYTAFGGTLGGTNPAKTQNAIVSGLITARYTYNGKYTFNGSFREDGASQLPTANRWTGFYSVGGAWEMSKEDFIRDIKAINNLRFRVSYGGSGNANNAFYGDFGYYSAYSQGQYSGLTTLYASQPGNPNLKWEITKTLDFGIDYSLLNNRVYGTLDYYRKRTTDAYAQLGLSATAGFGNGGSQFVNAGIVTNNGFEYLVNVDVVKNSNVTWTLSANGSYNKNNVASLSGISSFTAGTSLIEVGKPLGSQYTVKYGGVDAASGAPLYYDLKGNLTTTYSSSYQQNAFGTWVAPWNGGFGTTLTIREFSLSANFSYQKDSYKSNNVNYFVENPVGFMQSGYNQANTLNFWQKPGDKASTPSPAYAVNFSSQQIEDASFLRLRNVTLAYSMPRSVLNKWKVISNMRFYVMGQNLLLWTKWRGYDPESGAPNIVLGEYPNPRSFTGGIELTF